MRDPGGRRPCSRTVPGKMLMGYGAARGVHGLVRTSASGRASPDGRRAGGRGEQRRGAGLAGAAGDADWLDRELAIVLAGARGPGAGLITDSDVEPGRHPAGSPNIHACHGGRPTVMAHSYRPVPGHMSAALAAEW